MFNVLNLSRGSQNLDKLQKTIVTDLFEREPSLFIFEVPLLNMGVPHGTTATSSPNTKLSEIQSFIADVAAHSQNWNDYQMVMMLPNLSIYLDAWYDGSNEYKGAYNSIDKKFVTAKDYFDIVSKEYFNSQNIGFVNTFAAFMNEVLLNYDTYTEGLTGSGEQGQTFTSDGTHPNKRGADTYFKFLDPLFNN
jgi:hypothetical protein